MEQYFKDDPLDAPVPEVGSHASAQLLHGWVELAESLLDIVEIQI